MKAELISKQPVKVGLISLGCAKNLVDAEIIVGALLKDGMEITNDVRQADVVLVNTCSFIEPAQQESVDAILESANLRATHQPHQALVVSGCLPQRFPKELPALLPEVDAFMGIDQVELAPVILRQALAHRQQRVNRSAEPEAKDRLPASTAAHKKAETAAQPPAADPPIQVIHVRPAYLPTAETPRFRLTPRHFTYLKIAEGCNHPCSFCAIPRIRGSHRSRVLEDVVDEAQRLLADGVKELNLISQDTTFYGRDLQRAKAAGNTPSGLPATEIGSLCHLLRRLNDLPGEFWIRVLYTHPAHWTDELIHTIAECPKVARYVDIPLQHIHPVMLERMRRETTRESIEQLLVKIRSTIPGITLRTTFIVGFPGETAAYFEALEQFVEATRFERLGVFAYSPEEGTRAAKMAGAVGEAIKLKRQDRLMRLQRRISHELGASRVGKTLKVLVEGRANSEDLSVGQQRSSEHGLLRNAASSNPVLPRQVWAARSQADAPDIDGRVYVRGKLSVGQFVEVRVTSHTDYDLMAEPI